MLNSLSCLWNKKGEKNQEEGGEGERSCCLEADKAAGVKEKELRNKLAVEGKILELFEIIKEK
ncbi:hypothetical protein HPP92_023691 [Vanilla planifolia]|uniref:Uncharacterized protein n=1 Tax=Vanilla planifolia TaxID=51239 RepID=A0A835UC89_VANPL|nr:hypothetical protein HPP92_023691 [Vanilla planifolia]